ncbi:MAG: IS66 family insertion sequence element accessory protein TnpB [Methyloprofundus sp.]|jgi:hypothetical protein|nr:IS66 family insertion sequence element accessory protein TnpB [Methyloprofundus sp.]
MALSKHWIKHIEAWQRSDLTQAAYCRQQQLNAKSFSGRLRHYRELGLSTLPEVIPVQVTEEEPQPLPQVLVLTVQGCRLEVPATVSAQWLSQLMRCLS